AFDNISDESDEISVRLVAGDPQFVLTPAIENYLNTHYWEVTSSTPVNSVVSLGINELVLPEGSPIVLEASAPGQTPNNLLGTFDEQYVRSLQSVTLNIVGVGVGKEFSLTVHDLLTPFNGDDVNDKLYIENIELTASHTVTLLDRWGVVQRTWSSFSNADPQFDFTTLAPGNYICVVEYALPGSTSKSKLTQMITVLRTK
ncbi:MAG: hypothetical protein HC859_11815, partial [Bacteroidia bacterium]|nr:hypothetical protein [Bacteroidia bacterium]